MMGNRGILHDDARHIVRPWQVRRWIACLTESRGIHRTVMRPHSYTELFFLDEAAAFSAGHRPCAECRHADYRRFRTLWEACFEGPAGADAIDAKLDSERREKRKKRSYRGAVSLLPDGTYIALDGDAWLVWQRRLLAWSDSGYSNSRARPPRAEVDVLTPPSIVAIFEAGYRPGIHPSAC